MVFSWLFGERRKQESEESEVGALFAQANRATNARDVRGGERLCLEIVRRTPGNADAWNMLGVNLIRRDPEDPSVRADAVLAWMRALTLRPGDARAADHLQAEIQFPDELVPALVSRLGGSTPAAEDAAGALAQIGAKARPALDRAAQAGGFAAERARAILTNLS